MVEILTARSCKKCKHRAREGTKLYCHRFPPVAHPIFAQGPNGQVAVAGLVSIFPEVQDMAWCSEYETGLIRAEDADQATIGAN